jgi:short-subunit dehydrogenase
VIARRRERLEELQKDVNAKIRPLCLDLTQEASVEEYKKLLEAEKPQIKVLVNASGFGRFGAFADIDLESQYRMIDLNAKAYVGITYVSLPYLVEGAEVYQLDSLSSFQPVPCINVYAATKAFVLSFSRALNVEWKSRGIRVMAVCPYWVKTEFFDRAKTDDTISYYNFMYEASGVVRQAIRDMKKGKDVSVHGKYPRFQVLLVKLLPHKMVMKIWCKQQKIK